MTVKKELINYKQYGNLIDDFCGLLKMQGYNYADAIFAPPRGGWPIAVHLSHNLDIPIVYEPHHGNSKELTLLIVDDIADTGDTLFDIVQFLRKKWETIFTATLYYKPHSKFKPDTYLKLTEDWIVFPWECKDEKPNREMYEHL